ncbi:MAG: CPXCG motif-containing cysteine-rich protein [Rhodanobacter sp.]|nr:MAG: CPXCG motif-containing cysteine-rich protein [Rhodanobacter sp.]
MLTPCTIDCPYCGEAIEILVDASIPRQQYIEDCQVCCRPISLSVAIDEDDADAGPPLRASDENEA